MTRRTLTWVVVVMVAAVAAMGGGVWWTTSKTTADRQAAAVTTYPACTQVWQEAVCMLGPDDGGPGFDQTTVLNGASVLFAGAAPAPAMAVTLVDTCWAPAGEVDPVACTSAGLTPPPGFVTITTIDGFPAVSFDAAKVPDPSPEAPADGVYPLPGYVDVSVDGRTVRIEIACCSRV